MNTAFKEKWVAALESGDYEQCREGLKILLGSVDNGNYGYCCLGVACDISDEGEFRDFDGEKDIFILFGYDEAQVEADVDNVDEYIASTGGIPRYLRDQLGLNAVECETLTSMNDGEYDLPGSRKSFREIAQWIRENL